jgi:hypothetical protein
MFGPKGDPRILRFVSASIKKGGEMRLRAVLRHPSRHKGKPDLSRYDFEGSLARLGGSPALKGEISARFPFFRAVRGAQKNVRPLEIKSAIDMNALGASFDKVRITQLYRDRPQMMTGRGRLDWREGKIILDGELKSRLLDLDHLKGGLRVGGSIFESISSLLSQLAGLESRINGGKFRMRLDQIKLNGDLVQNVDLLLERGTDGMKVQKLFARLPGDNVIRLGGNIGASVEGGNENRAGGTKKADANEGYSGNAGARPLFAGGMMLRGQSLGRLVAWAGGGAGAGSSVIHSRPFSLRGQLEIGENEWRLREAGGDIAGAMFNGSLRQKMAGGRKNGAASAKSGAMNGGQGDGGGKSGGSGGGELDLKLTSSEIDMAALLGRPLGVAELIGSLRKAGVSANKEGANKNGKREAESEKKGLWHFLQNNILRLQLRIGRLKLADFTGQDIVCEIFYGLEKLRIDRLALYSPSGLNINIDGSIDNIEGETSGSLNGSLEAPDGKGLARLFSWFGHGDASAGYDKRRIAGLAPLRLAFMLRNDERGDGARIDINGVAGASRLSISNRLIGARLFSRRGEKTIRQIETGGTVSNEEGGALLSQIAAIMSGRALPRAKLGRGRLWLNAAGLPGKGMSSRMEFSSSGLNAGMDGLFTYKDSSVDFRADAHLETGERKILMALAGLAAPQAQERKNAGEQAGAVSGADKRNASDTSLKAHVSKKGDHIVLSKIDGQLAGGDIQGQASFDISTAPDKKPHQAEIALLTSSLDLPSLLSLLLENDSSAGGERNNPLRDAEKLAVEAQDNLGLRKNAILTSRRLDREKIAKINANIFIVSDKINLGGGLELHKGELTLASDKGVVSIDSVAGDLWGGSFKGHGRLDLNRAVPELSGGLKMNGADLEKAPLALDGAPLLAGRADLDIDFTARGISPAGMLALMNGKGKLKVENGRINRFSSAVLHDFIKDELAAWGESEDNVKTSFEQRFRRHLLAGEYEFGGFETPLVIKDGQLSLAQEIAPLNGAGNKARIDAALALAGMNSHVRITIAPDEAQKNMGVSPLAIIYKGPLYETDKVTAQFELSSLKQVLTVMKMEHDVELLEKLHRRDEEFAREAARRRELYRQQKEREKQGLGMDGDIAGGMGATGGAESGAGVSDGGGRKSDWKPFGETFDAMQP